MKNSTEIAVRTGMMMGAIAGMILFLIFGIIPGFYFGSYGTLALLSYIVGGPVGPGLITRALIVAGTISALLLVAAASIVVGSAVGVALALIVEAIPAAPRSRRSSEKERSDPAS